MFTTAPLPPGAHCTDAPCPRCGGVVACAMHAAEGCWCARLPRLALIDTALPSCLCANCLCQAVTDEAKR